MYSSPPQNFASQFLIVTEKPKIYEGMNKQAICSLLFPSNNILTTCIRLHGRWKDRMGIGHEVSQTELLVNSAPSYMILQFFSTMTAVHWTLPDS